MTTPRRQLLVSAAAAGLLALGCGAGTASSTPAGATASAAGSGATPPTGSTAPPPAAVAGAPATGSTSASTTSGGHAPAPSATPHGLATRATVDRAHGVVDVVVTVTGPAEILGGCEPSLSPELVDAAGAPVSTPSPPAGVRCLAIAVIPVAAGATREFAATIPIPPGGHGTFRVVGQLRGSGAIPPVTVDL